MLLLTIFLSTFICSVTTGFVIGADRTITKPLNTPEDIRELYCDNITKTPQELDKCFDVEFLTKNAGSIKIATKITDGYNISYPFQTVEPFVSTWEFTEEMSLLEGLVIYMDGGDPTVSIYAKRLFLDTEFKQFNLEQFDQEKDVINSSEHKKMLRKNTIITCIGAMHYDTDSKKRISSLLDWYLIKIIADTYNVLSDADLKFIAGCRPGSITAYLSSRYNPYYNFTNTQLTRLKKAGFQIEQSQHSDDTPNTTDKELDQ